MTEIVQNNTEDVKILCLINGSLMHMEDVWNKYASNKNEDCTIPKEELLVNSIDSNSKIIKKKITKINRKKISKLKEIRLENGYMIHVTDDQHLLKIDGWTNNLNVGDFVCIPKKLYNCHEKCKLNVSASLAYVLSWQIGEGCESTSNTTVNIYQDDIKILEKIQKEAKNIGLIYDLKMNSLAVRKRKNHKHEKAHEISIGSVAYINFLKKNGFDYGHTARWKSIPDFIMNATIDCIKLFLRAYFDAEAWMDVKGGEIEISSASQMIIRQLDVLCRLVGINMRTKMKMKMATNGKRIKRPYWIGLISGPSLRIFLKEINFEVDYKKRDLEIACKRTCNTNIDVIPITKKLQEIYNETQLPKRRFIDFSYIKIKKRKKKIQLPTIDMLTKTIENLKDDLNDNLLITNYNLEQKINFIEKSIADLQKEIVKEVYYIPIKSITEKIVDEYIYDFEIEDTYNYVLGGVLVYSKK